MTAVVRREVETAATYSVRPTQTLAGIIEELACTAPEFVAFQIPVAGGRREVTAERFAQHVEAVAKGLIASGIETGDRVAIMASTRYEWVLLDFAIWAAGACTVAIYDASASDQARWILADSGTRLLVVETAQHAAVVAHITTPVLAETLRIDQGAIDELVARGAEIDDRELRERTAGLTAASPATLIYTSGTSGRPKGVVLTHANLLAVARSGGIAMSGVLQPGQRTLMFLPLAHVFARCLSVLALMERVTVAHTADWSTLGEQFISYQPDFVLAVPRVFEKVYNAAEQRAHESGKGWLFDRAAATAIDWSRALDDGDAGWWLRLRHSVFDRLVYTKLRAALGGRCRYTVSGGGPLGERLGHFFRGVGITIFEGYGLTETSAAITVNTLAHLRIGSVGKPIDGNAVRVAADGELLVKGSVVFPGYWRDEQANRDAFEGEWFRTGDLGAIDRDGFVTITGRKKEILVTAGGKNVSPGPLEDALRAHPLIGQCMVVGDGQPFVAALVTIDREALQDWRRRHGVNIHVHLAELLDHPGLIAEIDAAVAETNSEVSKAESIRRIRVLVEEWTQEGGELTAKLSLRRAVITQRYAAEIAGLYS
ncbi:AMP-dependent synthetase/ligase [Nocardia sp. NPDC059240]|uniref:AMP-dependent synthetase/ligase n=1 Tax=Nocardia sp. NPDC059240 TaxID=3346786 RepID=UPI00368F05A7